MITTRSGYCKAFDKGQSMANRSFHQQAFKWIYFLPAGLLRTADFVARINFERKREE
jgi:hypothetical protein